MKKITINGTEYPLPPEAEWVAMDADGVWTWAKIEPDERDYFFRPSGGRYGIICHTPDYTGNWRETKRRV